MGKCPGGKCLGGKCLGGICPWGKCPGGTCPGGGGYVLPLLPLQNIRNDVKRPLQHCIHPTYLTSLIVAGKG